MMTPHISPVFRAAFAALAVLASVSEAGAAQRSGRQAYSGANMGCLVGNDFYAVHFTAIQEGHQQGERTDFAKYCQEVPAVGKTYLSIDLLDRDVRKTPIALKVVEEEFSEDDGRPPKVLRTLNESPAKIYGNGVADIPADITQPGHYALIATIGEQAVSEDDRLRIPFTVAIEGAAPVNWLGKITGAIALMFFGVMAFIGFRTYRAYRPKRPVEEPMPAAPAKAELG
jgi:hypothetical protein